MGDGVGRFGFNPSLFFGTGEGMEGRRFHFFFFGWMDGCTGQTASFIAIILSLFQRQGITYGVQ